MSVNIYDKSTDTLNKVAGGGIFPCDFGTRAEFEAKKDDLPVGTVFTTTDEFEDDISELKKSVSDGKTLVADAITQKGVATASDDTFATMAENIGYIFSSSVKGSNKGNLVTSFTSEIGKFYFLQCVYALSISGATILNSCRGETVSGVDSTGYLVKATSTTVRANHKFGWISVD